MTKPEYLIRRESLDLVPTLKHLLKLVIFHGSKKDLQSISEHIFMARNDYGWHY